MTRARFVFGGLESLSSDGESESDGSLKKSAFLFPKLALLLPRILAGGEGEDSGESEGSRFFGGGGGVLSMSSPFAQAKRTEIGIGCLVAVIAVYK